MHERGCETDGVHHRAAADDDDERLPVHVRLQHQPHEALDEREVILDRLAARHDARCECEFDLRGVGGETIFNLAHEIRSRGGDVRIHEHERAMPALLAEPAHRLHEHAIFRAEKSVRECHREIPFHRDALIDRPRLAAHRWPSIQDRTAPARSSCVTGSCGIFSDVAQATSRPARLLPCVPRILRVSKLTLPGGHPK